MQPGAPEYAPDAAPPGAPDRPGFPTPADPTGHVARTNDLTGRIGESARTNDLTAYAGEPASTNDLTGYAGEPARTSEPTGHADSPVGGGSTGQPHHPPPSVHSAGRFEVSASHASAIAGPPRPAQRAEQSTHRGQEGVTGGAVATTTDIRQMPVAPALRAGTPDDLDPPEPPPLRASDFSIGQRGLRAAMRARRAKRLPDAEPTMARIFGQFGLLGLSVLAIIVTILLACMLGFEIVTRR